MAWLHLLDISFGVSASWWLPAVGCAVVAAWLAYGRPRNLPVEWPLWLRWLLPVLRGLAALLVASLLLEPVWSHIFAQRQPATIAVLVDDSRSLTASRDSAWVRRELPLALGRLRERLEGAGIRVDAFAFADRLNPLPSADSLRHLGTQTDLAAAMDQLTSRYWDRQLAAVAVVTDGIVTRGGSPLYAGQGLTAPVFTAWVGDTASRRDIRIQEVEANRITYKDAETPLRIQVWSQGFAATPLRVQALLGKQVLATGTVTVRSGQPATTDLLIRLDQPGLQAVDIVVESRAGEWTTRNNRQRLYIQVLETRQRILILAGGPHPDIGALRNAFRDQRYSVTTAVRRTETTFYTPLADSALAQADLVILHNFPASAADQALMSRIAEGVRQRNLPLWTIYGTRTAENVVPNQTDLLGISPNTPGQRRNSEAELRLTPAYANHASNTGGQPFAEWMDGLPALTLPEDAQWTLAPGSLLFGTQTIKGIPLERPMLALRETGNRKTAVLVGENLWRWRMQAYVQDRNFDLFDSWLQNLAQWLVVRQDRRRFRVAPTQPLFSPGEAIVLRGEVYDDLYRPLSGAEVQATVTDSAGRKTDVLLLAVGPGQYSGQLPALPEGTYRYTAAGVRNGTNLGRDAGQLTVGPSTAEFRDLQANAALLAQWSRRTGGVSVPATQLDALADSLLALPNLKPTLLTRTEATPAHRLWLVLLLIVGLLTTEWVLRKRFGTV